MNDQEYKQWVAALTTLTSAQLNDVSNRIKILSFASTKEFNGKADFGVRVSEVICNVFRKLGVESPNPNTLRKSAAYVSAKAKFDDLAAFFEKASQQRLVQDRLLTIAVENLYYEIVQWGIPVSSHTMLNQIHRLPSVLNRSFPGYAQSGLLHKLVKHEN